MEWCSTGGKVAYGSTRSGGVAREAECGGALGVVEERLPAELVREVPRPARRSPSRSASCRWCRRCRARAASPAAPRPRRSAAAARARAPRGSGAARRASAARRRHGGRGSCGGRRGRRARARRLSVLPANTTSSRGSEFLRQRIQFLQYSTRMVCRSQSFENTRLSEVPRNVDMYSISAQNTVTVTVSNQS